MRFLFRKNNKKVFIIAEISANHGQDFNRAVEMIKKAKECGADAVKFQTYTPDTITVDVNNKYFRIKHDQWGGQTLYQLYQKAYTPWNWFKKLKKVADQEGIIFFSSVFDKTAVDLLEDLGVCMHKISSFELNDLPLIEYTAKTKKPLLMSTGMATLSEIKKAVNAAKRSGAKSVGLFKCVSSYPADPSEMNLRTIPNLIEKFQIPIGLSDHTLGIAASIAAVSLGATMIEKHFTLSRDIKTEDSFFSIDPTELKILVDSVRSVEKALGKVYYGNTQKEKESRAYRRSLFVVNDIKKGNIFSEENVRSVRPANGLEPKYINRILGKRAKFNIKKGTPIQWDLIS
ncbi:MAG: pseudaminic acid synthase [Candidatus Omnitrophica bacterium]|nr:pseudaminic acid synthase [Candidatus Omnitrophota bacterium]